MNEKCAEWTEAENIDYTLSFLSPGSVTRKFSHCLKHRFGLIRGISDQEDITNSDALTLNELFNLPENQYQTAFLTALAPSGAITEIILQDTENKPKDISRILHFIYENKLHAKLLFK